MATAKKVAVKKTATKAPKAAVEKTEKKVTVAGGEMPVYSMAGAKVSSIILPGELFGAKWNSDLVHQVVVGMQANARQVTADTKGRGEVRGGGKKPWKQKGTGRARHGSTRSPIWKGGGVTHGPKAERIFAVKINKKMRGQALIAVLSRKAKDGEIVFVDKFTFAKPSTKTAKGAIAAVAKAAGAGALVTKAKNAGLVVFSDTNAMAKKSFRNISNVSMEEIRNLNPVDVMTSRYLVIENPAKAFEVLMARAGK